MVSTPSTYRPDDQAAVLLCRRSGREGDGQLSASGIAVPRRYARPRQRLARGSGRPPGTPVPEEERR